ncbi:hypothetical protein YDYSY3_13840 [Paenibacillus chitinolyticus]|nr:hypothetical protein YDYSY3_13840 [Paenibacillus chitinolyticus]
MMVSIVMLPIVMLPIVMLPYMMLPYMMLPFMVMGFRRHSRNFHLFADVDLVRVRDVRIRFDHFIVIDVVFLGDFIQ